MINPGASCHPVHARIPSAPPPLLSLLTTLRSLLPLPPCPFVTSKCTLETPYPSSLPRTPHARPPPPTPRPPDATAAVPALFPTLRRRPVSDQPLLFETPSTPTPSPRPRTQPLQRRPAAPSQPQPSSPTRQKNRPKLSLASPNPLWGFGLARDSSPFTPTQFPPPGTRPRLRPIPATAPCRAAPHPPASRPALATPPWQDPAHPRHTPVRPSPPVPWRVPASPEERPAEPQEFFGKNSYARKPTPFRAPTRPSRGPASPRDH